jgi:[protein-PII] uridylyltransferase
MLLTLADGQGTSAEGWSDWKESLVWQLYHSTSRYLADRAGFFEQQKIERETLRRHVLETLSPDFAEELETQFESMPDNYFRAFNVEEVASHARLFRGFLGNLYADPPAPLAPAVEAVASPRYGHSTVSLCTWDRRHLLAKIAGSFAAVPLNILSADIYTRADNVVLDIFRVCAVDGRAVTQPEEIARFQQIVRAALTEDSFDFAPFLENARPKSGRSGRGDYDFPTRITADNKSHPTYTLVQIETADRLGLLYDLLRVLGEQAVSIALSRISTEKGAAIDTFYVVETATRGKLSGTDRIRSLQTELQRAAVGAR